mmetsp:Transcript_10062/g.22881  ORF Transcript_10062/g.22881 Transcript_10062/m.22881 type:complete len:202 (+) Transcript_10062:596-1201(+)
MCTSKLRRSPLAAGFCSACRWYLHFAARRSCRNCGCCTLATSPDLTQRSSSVWCIAWTATALGFILTLSPRAAPAAPFVLAALVTPGCPPTRTGRARVDRIKSFRLPPVFGADPGLLEEEGDSMAPERRGVGLRPMGGTCVPLLLTEGVRFFAARGAAVGADASAAAAAAGSSGLDSNWLLRPWIAAAGGPAVSTARSDCT